MPFDESLYVALEKRVAHLEEFYIRGEAPPPVAARSEIPSRSRVLMPTAASPLRVGMICEIDAPCGIGEHTQYLVTGFAPVGLTCSWLRHDATAQEHVGVLRQCVAEKVDVVHIQHDWSFWRETRGLLDLIRRLHARGIPVVLDFHAVGEADSPQQKILRRSVPVAVTHNVRRRSPRGDGPNKNEEFPDDAGPYFDTDLVPIPLALPVVGPPRGRALLRAAEWVALESGVIFGTFGFLGEHKGHIDVAETVLELRKRGVPARFLLMASHHPRNPAEILSRRLADLAGTDPEGILHIDDFLPIETCVGLLALANATVLNYQVDSWSQSGSAAVAAMAGRPVVASDCPMFADLPLVRTWPMKDRNKMRQALQDVVDMDLGCETVRVLSWAMDRRADVLAQQYRDLYERAKERLAICRPTG